METKQSILEVRKGRRRRRICTESVLKIMDAGYCLYVHIFVFF